LQLDEGIPMQRVSTGHITTGRAALVIGEGTLLLRGARNAPFGHLAPVVPDWRLLVARAGPVVWRAAGRSQHAAALLVPPEVRVDAAVVDAIAVLHFDACTFGLPPTPLAGRVGVVPLFTIDDTVRELLWSIGNGAGLERLSIQVLDELRDTRVLPPASARDRRVALGLDAAHVLGSITEAAATVGLSRARFRSLVREQVGSAPTRLRIWRRLRCALALMDERDLAEAAATAGFADQAHLTRTCTRFLGASPGRLRPLMEATSPSALRTRPCVEDRTWLSDAEEANSNRAAYDVRRLARLTG
jgi:AraC-like DNA-binding protein